MTGPMVVDLSAMDRDYVLDELYGLVELGGDPEVGEAALALVFLLREGLTSGGAGPVSPPWEWRPPAEDDR